MSAAPLVWGGLAAGAYLLGSVSFSYLIVRLLQGRDVRTLGSGNAGATNVMRAAGKVAGVAALLLDAGKGIAAVVAARALDAPPAAVAGAAVAVVLGHVFPVFLGFRGGKGVATAAGAMGALAPPALALSLLVFLAAVATTRYVSLGSVLAAVSFPLVLAAGRVGGWLAGQPAGDPAGDRWVLGAGAVVAALIVLKHRGNLARIARGSERRLGQRRAEAAPGEAGAAGGRGGGGS